METSSIKIERKEDITIMTYNVISSKTKNIIGSPTVYIKKYDNDDFFVLTDDFSKNVEKNFNNEDDADLFAMKILINDKKKYN